LVLYSGTLVPGHVVRQLAARSGGGERANPQRNRARNPGRKGCRLPSLAADGGRCDPVPPRLKPGVDR
jgi:hypothetical protein